MLEIPHPKYFEGILQLRGCKPEVIRWVYETVAKDRRTFITKEKKVRGGIDLYFSSQKYLRAIGKRLNERFLGEYKQTRTLHTVSKKTGKPLYRVTAMFRQLPYKVGDVITFKGEEHKIVACGNQIRLREIKTGKKKSVKPSDIRF